MFTSLIDWLDHRAGIRKLVGAMLLEGVPGGARWRYVWGSCLAFVFSIQLITGIMLMTAYSPSASASGHGPGAGRRAAASTTRRTSRSSCPLTASSFL